MKVSNIAKYFFTILFATRIFFSTVPKEKIVEKPFGLIPFLSVHAIYNLRRVDTALNQPCALEFLQVLRYSSLRDWQFIDDFATEA